MEKNMKKSHFAVQQKLKQHCKSTVFQKFFKKKITTILFHLTIFGELGIQARLGCYSSVPHDIRCSRWLVFT